MNTAQIGRILQSDPHTWDVFVDVYAQDQLPKRGQKYPSAYVCNTDPHTEEGEHWIAIYVDEHG